MKKMFLTALLIAGLATVFTGCDSAGNLENVRSGRQPIYRDVVDYGNGVYHFDYVREEFGNALSAFISAHPDLELVSMTGNGTGMHGYDQGYFVVFRKKM